jgi:VIT1/CCC1 family predicted Fe2+/Mn2+ transporter
MIANCTSGGAAHIVGARLWPAALRVAFWEALAMGVTMGVGAAFGTVI